MRYIRRGTVAGNRELSDTLVPPHKPESLALLLRPYPYAWAGGMFSGWVAVSGGVGTAWSCQRWSRGSRDRRGGARIPLRPG